MQHAYLIINFPAAALWTLWADGPHECVGAEPWPLAMLIMCSRCRNEPQMSPVGRVQPASASRRSCAYPDAARASHRRQPNEGIVSGSRQSGAELWRVYACRVPVTQQLCQLCGRRPVPTCDKPANDRCRHAHDGQPDGRRTSRSCTKAEAHAQASVAAFPCNLLRRCIIILLASTVHAVV